ncbi:hypothetical protein C0992_003708 [Termitomyces sp. T32_za158]|nr:hypothetical protein C0992_003708 [Termitomyces sp. T32_za158]
MEHTITDLVEEEDLPPTNPEEHHYISRTKHTALNLLKWATDHEDDPAIKDFVPKLMEHLLARFLQVDVADLTDEHRDQLVVIRDNMIYEHKTLRINYTTYDNRREQDTINPNRQSDVMFLADEDDQHAHPYWEDNHSREWNFYGDDDEENLDYERYYVNMFVDRDMFVRFMGNGIGHRASREATRLLMADAEEAFLDVKRELVADSASESSDNEQEELTAGIEDPYNEQEEEPEPEFLDDDEVNIADGEDNLFDESLGYGQM